MNKEALLAHFPKMSYRKYQSLCDHFGNIDSAWNTTDASLKSLPWKEAALNEFIDWRKHVQEAALEATLKKENITCITISDPSYPPLLRHLYDPPLCLFIRGTLQKYRLPIAVVGPRKYSSYGKYVTDSFVEMLARSGMCIVSGLAIGIDAIAHESALRVGGGTIAVLGSGVDENSIHPRQNVLLAQKILRSDGALISEFPPGTAPTVYSFPQRNRIIAGLCLGTLVIEASSTSGALITAHCSNDMGRDVFAVPQSTISPTSAGVNRLIQEGAHLVTGAQEILEILNIKSAVKNPDQFAELSAMEATICKQLTNEPKHIDDIVKASAISSATAASTLTVLEIRGRVKNLGNMMYILLS